MFSRISNSMKMLGQSQRYYTSDVDFKIAVYPCSSFLTNCFVMWDENSTLIVDTPQESYEYLKDHEAMTNDEISILITHGHYDHVGDLIQFQNNFKVKTYYGENEESVVREGVRMFSTEDPFVTEYVYEGTKLETDFGTCEILEIPGHTPGSIGYYFPDLEFVFVGDVLFRDSIGRTDLGGGDFNILSYSIKEKLYKLPDDTAVFPGHGRETSIGYEKVNNQFVREGF